MKIIKTRCKKCKNVIKYFDNQVKISCSKCKEKYSKNEKNVLDYVEDKVKILCSKCKGFIRNEKK